MDIYRLNVFDVFLFYISSLFSSNTLNTHSFTQFQSAGREDVDVRMLGGGRPFCIRLLDCWALPFLSPVVSPSVVSTLQSKLMEGVKVKVLGVQVLTNAEKELDMLVKGQENKRKKYSCVCVLKSPVDFSQLRDTLTLQTLDILQKTPLRVAHRRSIMDRSRVIYDTRVERTQEGTQVAEFELFLTTSAGAYVKEFVCGDMGRTRPSMASLLGVDVVIQTLDVEDILME